MRRDPNGGAPLPADRYQLLTVFTDPDAYLPILRAYPRLRVCLAHFGGAGDWHGYLQHPWDAQRDSAEKSWLAKILDLLRSGDYPNLWTDISYTLFTDDTYSYLLKVLLADASVRSRVLFGSDFYVVESANQEERNRAIRIRAILGEDLFTTIAVANPTVFLNGPSAADAGLDHVSVSA